MSRPHRETEAAGRVCGRHSGCRNPGTCRVSRRLCDHPSPLPSALEFCAERLEAGCGSGPLDLRDRLLIVPTRHAGRRLREELARRAAARGSAVIPGPLTTPGGLCRPPESAQTAPRSVTAAVWADLLRETRGNGVQALFPRGGNDREADPASDLALAERIQRLREELDEEDSSIAHLAEMLAERPGEGPRWRDLLRLEELYRERLAGLGFTDPCDSRRAFRADPALPEGVERICVLCVPDPLPAAISVLERFAQKVPVEIWVHAPEDLAPGFDAWGRPDPDFWTTRTLPFDGTSVHATADTGDQVTELREALLRRKPDTEPPLIGVPDREVGRMLSAELESAGVEAYDPAGRPLRHHALYRLLDHLVSLLRDGSCGSVARFLRHPRTLGWLESRIEGFDDEAFLRQLDDCRDRHLVTDREALRERAGAMEDGSLLRRAVEETESLIGRLEGGDFPDALAGWLEEVYRTRAWSRSRAEDRLLAEAARAVLEALDEVRAAPGARWREAAGAGTLLLHRLRDEAVYEERDPRALDLLGWLELPWEPSARLWLSGMHEGAVPASVIGDPFLPDGLREEAGFRDNAFRYARDVYLLESLLRSREGAHVSFFLSRSDASGEPLKPSRLLFHCTDEALPDRTRQLFSAPPPMHAGAPFSVPWHLQPPDPAGHPLECLYVTDFRAYLESPLCFYFRRVLDMEPLDESRMQMDARAFGSIAHGALEQMGRDRSVCDSTDESELAAFLESAAGRLMRDRYGRRWPAPLAVQWESLRRRLRQAARVQARERRAGWRIAEVERDAELELGGFSVRGRIDRIDRHETTGALRVLDYKTTDRVTPPARVHLARWRGDAPACAHVEVMDRGSPRSYRWLDLQLPLYLLMTDAQEAPVQCGYFVLPKATSETEVLLWEDLDAGLAASARTCAEAIAGRIRRGEYTPLKPPAHGEDWDPLFVRRDPSEVCAAPGGGEASS
ncbi:PD-(D/E)XK nuclease family protein [Kiritimatiella glycovorans]|uniref:Double-strand break repair protein AddB n=1 Tax=Kiritimatiella glycovorans TaxID=1307763 RepID=A0A0G3EGV2_9BACT|nr:PD-(D/E)XK nuclease family protein [Kiritimatiella glycovorans]AKJ65583.1 double-strand break repair protein AddB [Kiritimatiella glycovorans]